MPCDVMHICVHMHPKVWMGDVMQGDVMYIHAFIYTPGVDGGCDVMCSVVM